MFMKSSLLLALISICSLQAMHGDDSDNEPSPLNFTPKYEHHLKELVNAAFWGTVNVGLFALCTEMIKGHNEMVMSKRGPMADSDVVIAIGSRLLVLNFFVKTLNHTCVCLIQSTLLANEAWKAVSGFGQLPRKQ